MARALIVGCGCRGVELGKRLAAQRWEVRGTTRSEDGVARIEAAGFEAAVADPDRPGTILDLVADVALVVWLLASVRGEPDVVAAIHGPRLEALLVKLVDSPVRGFAYEAAGSVERVHLERGAESVKRAAATWKIPVAVLRDQPGGDWNAWAEATDREVTALLG